MPLEELGTAIAARGPLAYLVTVGDPAPRVVSVSVEVEVEGSLVVAAGRHSAANVEARPAVTVFWPPDADDPHHTLLVDGQAAAIGEGTIRVVPTGAIRHRIRAGSGS